MLEGKANKKPTTKNTKTHYFDLNHFSIRPKYFLTYSSKIQTRLFEVWAKNNAAVLNKQFIK